MIDFQITPQMRFWFRTASIVLFSAVIYVLLAFAHRSLEGQKRVVVYGFSDMISAEVFHDFEKETGIKVVVRHFEAIDELTTKLLYMKECDIDVVALTDVMVKVFSDEKLLSPLNKKLLPSYSELDGRLLSKHYDPKNTFSVPYCWSPVGIGYDSRIIKTPRDEIDWDIVFGNKNSSGYLSPVTKYGVDMGNVCLGEDAWETIFLSSIHKYGTIYGLNEKRQSELVEHLREQKKWLECYTNNLKYFLISGISHVVVTPGAYIHEMREEHDWAEFVIPRKGSLVIIGSLAIPRVAKKRELSHKVIDYLISKKGGLACFEEHAYNPANKRSYGELPEEIRTHQMLFPGDELFARLTVESNYIPFKRVEQMWREIKQ